jgi:uncharacterized membrane protein YdfJ with MMPL/SSD domain
MKKIIKGRFAIFFIWLIATILLTAFQPDINSILRTKGQESLSKDSPSVVASSILSKMETSKGTNDLIVFYNENKISDDEMKQIGDGVKSITDSKSELGIGDMIDPFSMPDAKSSLISKDGTTLMVSFKLDKQSREIDDIKKDLDSKLTNVKTEYFLSGEDFINNDYLKASEAGVEKSAALTVIFILVVLVLMFRSVVTPLVSLVAVAFSYLCSMGIVAQLIDKAGFPLTSLTQMLLILILFGIGTDYNILLFNRFKEELSHGHSIDDAIMNTYKTAGKTIAFSILTVFIAFLSLVFAESPIYQSGVSVVIGVVILLLEILTLTPFIMKVLGKKLFWPSKTVGGHKENKFWGKTASVATKHPIISVIVVLLIIGPMIYLNEQKLNFDTIKELGDSYPSSKAINIVADHFGKGQAMPTTVVIESSKDLNNNESLSVIDDLTERIKSIEGVKQVSSITQPQAEKIDGFYIGSQTKKVTDGLSASQNGINQIYEGLKETQNRMGRAVDFSKMLEGLNGISGGLGKTNDFLSELNTNQTFNMPESALTNDSFKPALNMFMSSDRTITKMNVVLNNDPYSKEALDTIERINETVSNGLKGTVLSEAKFGAAGPSATTNDMNNILTRDLNRLQVIVLIGVLVVLILVIRSVWAPVVITASLMAAYYAAMFILNFIFIDIQGLGGISSFVPFFSFIIIVALGVDYSIFLMMRFKEYGNMTPKEAIVLASKHIGGVVMSAVIILGGTFATLMPSGIVLLTEWATAVITGLVVLCFILLPVFLPAMIAFPETLAKLFLKNRKDLNVDKKVA